MPVTEIPQPFFVLLAIGMLAALGVFGLAYLTIRRLGLTMTRKNGEWTMSKDQGSVFTKAIWGNNAHLEKLGVSRLIWALRLSFLTVVAMVLGCTLTIARAA